MKFLSLLSAVSFSLLAQAQVIDTTVLNEVVVEGVRAQTQEGVAIKSKDLEFSTGAEGGVETLVKTLIGVSSRNEMSSQYAVRGGNFDENLVYINGFEVFRPFLARSGQQEGMSIINPQLVSNIRFSAGGFNATYGDKLSSVLEVFYNKFSEREQATFEASLTGGSLSYSSPTRFRSSPYWKVEVGLRYRNNALLLGAMDQSADFRPVNTDAQIVLTRHAEGQYFQFFGHVAHNSLNQEPQSRQTSFGSLQEALMLNVYFDGRERFGYDTQFFGARWVGAPKHRSWTHSMRASAFHSTEHEISDIIGYYRLNELNNDLGSDSFGEISLVRGVGAYQEYRRNFLDAYIGNLQYNSYSGRTPYGRLHVGVQAQYENIYDRYKEWQRIDSAGYSVPHSASRVDSVVGTTLFTTAAEGLELFTHVSATQYLENLRMKAWFHVDRAFALDGGLLELEYGARLQWARLNGEARLSPRAQLRWKPTGGARTYGLSAGVYDQYPFYRELRRKDGTLDETVKSQQALHFIARTDKAFRMWDRPFVWSLEGYYKDLQRTNLYGVENVRIRYAANNDALGRVFGVDSRINGEFVEGTDSWFTFSLFRAQERPLGDSLWYARPTDTRFNFAIYFQDHLPNDPSTRMALTLMLGGSFPFGPDGPGDGILPPSERVFRSPPYRRADLSLIKVINAKWAQRFEEVWLSVDIFNLLQARNTISYLWVKDVSTARQYAVPNYMTTRLVNAKVHIDF